MKKNNGQLQNLLIEKDFANKKLIIETGKLALLADGAVKVQYGETTVLVTACVADKAKEEATFFPLTVEFEEKWYASGKISSSRFIKREGRPSESSILRARLIDRSIRPLFPKGYRNDVQVIITVLSCDLEQDPAFAGLLGASVALSLSGAPFEGPIGGVKVGLIDNELVINPATSQLEKSDLNLFVIGNKEDIVMLEADANQIPEEKMVEALQFAQKYIQETVLIQEEILQKITIMKKEYELFTASPEIYAKVSKYLTGKLGAEIRHREKYERQDVIQTLEDEVMEYLSDAYEEEEISLAFEKVIEEDIRKAIFEENTRPDNRKPEEMRPIWGEVDILPRVHGSALFNRGQTQVLSITTLASPAKALVVETMDQDTTKRFLHHYNFPPFSTGETRPLRGVGRREVGHSALVEKALYPLLPEKEIFPYTMRVVSEVLSCNGSSSMASVCASSMSLMATGVPIKKAAAGIALGLIAKDGNYKNGYKILMDIQGAEDFAGDMDLKVAGTTEGITTLQLDIKIKNLPLEILKEALLEARKARLFILEKMLEVIPYPRKDISPYAPRLLTIKIDPQKIREVIGKGGETINKIIAETGAEIDIEQDGTVVIASLDAQGGEQALDWVKKLTKEPEVGEIYAGKITKILDFGAFAEFLPGKEGLIHISQLADQHVNKVEDEVNVGDEVKVQLIGIDEMGRYNLSRKAAKS